VKLPDKKGLAVDDATFSGCPSKVPVDWPNTHNGIKSLRLFKAWAKDWPGAPHATWQHLRDYVHANDVKVFFGTQVSCSEESDDEDWTYVRELMSLIGPKHAMGLAIGNEIDLLWQKHHIPNLHQCVHRIWKGGYFWNTVLKRANDLKHMSGFEHLKLTTVMSGDIFGGWPFANTENVGILNFLRSAWHTFGHRWVFTTNVYPYFSGGQLDSEVWKTCNKAMSHDLCWTPGCTLPGSLVKLRQRIKALTHVDDAHLWLGETGWSSPMASTLTGPLARCKSFSTPEVFSLYYQGFLEWDLSLGPGVRGVDHAFYFAIRDSNNFGLTESFGLIENCSSTLCKLKNWTFA